MAAGRAGAALFARLQQVVDDGLKLLVVELAVEARHHVAVALHHERVRLEQRLAHVLLGRGAGLALAGAARQVVEARPDVAVRPGRRELVTARAARRREDLLTARRTREPCLRERALVLPRPVRRVGHVGRYVAGVVALHEIRRHDAVPSRRPDLPVHDALDRVAVHAATKRRPEGGVEVRTLHALRAGAVERVARPAGLHELRLAVREVSFVAPAGARQEHQRGSHGCGQQRAFGVADEPHEAGTLSAPDAGRGSPSSSPRAAAITVSATLSHEYRRAASAARAARALRLWAASRVSQATSLSAI